MSTGILAHERDTKGSSSGCRAAVRAVTGEQVFWDRLSLSLYCSAVCFSLSVLSRVWFIFSQQEPGGGGGKLTFFVVGINVACNHFATLPDLQVKP